MSRTLAAARIGAVALWLGAGSGCLYRSTPAPPAVAPSGPWPVGIEVVAQSCANCHVNGAGPTTPIPAIAGRPEAVLGAQMQAFKHDQASGATVMPRLIRGFTDAEIEQLARYFAAQPANP